MKHLEAEDRSKLAPPYDPKEIDPEFLPYLERINAKPFAATVQCCIGHMKYPTDLLIPPNSGGRWGYLQLLMTCPSAMWLYEQMRWQEWLIPRLSQLWSNRDYMPSYTNRYNFIIGFAWDASAWPTPAEEICSLLDKYHAAEPDEPEHLLNPQIPREGRRKNRPSLDKRKRNR